MLKRLIEYLSLLSDLSFWEMLLAQFQYLGAPAPVFLAALESLIPALPMVGIVLLNVTAHGFLLGFLYSWLGGYFGSVVVFLFFRHVVRARFTVFAAKHPKLYKAQNWVSGVNGWALFTLAIMPFTPAAFLNIAFALSAFSSRKFFTILAGAKFIMVLLLALFGQSFLTAFRKPWVILFTVLLFAALYGISKKLKDKHGL